MVLGKSSNVSIKKNPSMPSCQTLKDRIFIMPRGGRSGSLYIGNLTVQICTGKGVKICSANQGTVRQLDWLSGDAICKKLWDSMTGISWLFVNR